jgi:NAD-dependent SIR2 family protein deacetylase
MKNKIRTRLLNNPITIEDEGIEQVFQLMRSKETVLWVGAGFCYGSSAPTVQSLKAILYDNYSTIINQNREDLKLVNLDELTQRIIYRDSFHEKNRNELLDGLKQYFVFTSAKHPLQTIVSQIPYIDQIITTNYDNLFELAYESRINVIYNNDSYTKNKNSENSNLFKIHGDFSDYSSIVLSKNDYANFIANNDRNLIIGKIKEILATKTVIFIGFSFEDMDINGILNWILEVIGKNTHYIIIPNAPTHKVEFLKSKGINYINMTAESFINDISKRTKLSLLCDIQSENISYTRAKRTTIKNGFIPELTTYNGKVFLNRITPTKYISSQL